MGLFDKVNRTVSNLAHVGLFRRYDLRDMGNVLNKTAALIKRRGVGPVLAASKTALTVEEAETAFFVAADLVLSDGVIENDERRFLEELKAALGVSDAMAVKIVEVVVVKNRS
ncbi:MAG: tellurite resistance TerB family protein [Chloroflexi bacterium]|nr:tellurite resistance TerB family protein [Chloroflexota bacterium]